ncbi:MAG TPA: aminoglycoside phosphotransferase family protein [Micromonosporaceae bacterium]
MLEKACRAAGFDAASAELIRAGENHLYRLPGGVVARVTRPGQFDAAAKEVRVSQWLTSLGFPVVQALAVTQPVDVEGRAVTFWQELAQHRPGTMAELADLLRQLHALPAPNVELPPLAPFVRIRERIETAAMSDTDREWLQNRLAELQELYAELPDGLPWCAIHGDPWDGNIAVTADGPVLLDLERFGYGPPGWDLAAMAVDHITFGLLPMDDWAAFCDRYSRDVTRWHGFEVLRDIRELRKVTFAFQMAEQRADIADQAAYRLACLRGQHGPRPWGWTAVP